MASSTRGELTPRSRICSSTMARRCSRNSAAACGSSPTGLTGLSGAPLPLAVIVSAQGHASSGGLQVTLPSARGENFFDMRERGVDWRVHTPTAGERAFDDALGLPHGLRADALDADCADDLDARPAGIKRGNMRRAVQVTEGVFAAVDGTHFKFKRAL